MNISILFLLVVSAFAKADANDTDEQPYLIGYKHVDVSAKPLCLSKSKSSKQQEQHHALSSVHAVRANLTASHLQALSLDSNVLYVEVDAWVQKLSGEYIPYALDVIQATNADGLIPNGTAYTGVCSDPTSFKIGLVDSGIDASHPDLACTSVGNAQRATCVGTQYGTSLAWNKSQDMHGTMVAGIVTAIRNNGQGVEGVMTDSNVCLIVARVFGSTANSQARLSDVLSGVKWVADQGANVINLSLGGPDYSVTAKKIYDNIRSKGVLVVAASGNGGNALNSYPASFDSVMSVGAVDVNLKKASFSQYNSNVDLAAPGVGILSIVPVGTGDVIKLSVGADAFVVNLLSYSVIPDTTGVSGELVDCGFGKSTCPGSSTGGNHICLIERGTDSFEQMALNCQQSGAVAVFIYNNRAGDIGGTLAVQSQVNIPVASLLQQLGTDLANYAIGSTVTLQTDDTCTVADGTSFSSPYVAGSIASIWQACSSCTADQVQQCLYSSAKDLGPTGKDIFFGYGLVQVEPAYACLVHTAKCCSSAGSVPTPASAPVSSPVASRPVAPTSLASCASLQSTYNSCFNSKLAVWQETLCMTCVNSAIPDVTSVSCDATTTSICSATRDTCTLYCGTCVSDIENYLRCAINTQVNSCALNCNSWSQSKQASNTSGVAGSSNNSISIGIGLKNGTNNNPTAATQTQPTYGHNGSASGSVSIFARIEKAAAIGLLCITFSLL